MQDERAALHWTQTAAHVHSFLSCARKQGKALSAQQRLDNTRVTLTAVQQDLDSALAETAFLRQAPAQQQPD
jgi:hypothetical protein